VISPSHILTAVAVCLVVIGCTSTETPQSLDARAAAIDTGAASYRHGVRDLRGISVRAGTLDSFHEGAALQKLVATCFGKTGRAVDTFYFQETIPFLVVRTEERYGQPGGGRITWRTVERLYFSRGRLLRYVDAEGRVRDVTDGRVRDRADNVLADSRRLAGLLGGPGSATPAAPR
jgi:hypothetical protein